EPVWVSSVEHLQTFEKVYRETSYVRRLFGAYVLPEGFPFMRGWLCIPWRLPVVMFATGRVRHEDRRLDFEATPWRLPLSLLHQLRTDWRFTLTAQDVTALEPFEFVSPVTSYFRLPFTRIRSNQGGELADFLLCVGGLGPFLGKIRKRTAELSANL